MFTIIVFTYYEMRVIVNGNDMRMIHGCSYVGVWHTQTHMCLTLYSEVLVNAGYTIREIILHTLRISFVVSKHASAVEHEAHQDS